MSHRGGGSSTGLSSLLFDLGVLRVGAAPELVLERPPPEQNGVWELLYSPQEWTTPELRRNWQCMIEDRSYPRLIYQTPGWFDHLASIETQEQIAVAVTRDRTGQVNGIAPFRIAAGALDFHVSGHTLARIPVRKALMMGGLPLFPESGLLLDNLFAWMWSFLRGVDGISLSGVEVGSFLWRYLHSSAVLRERYLLHIVEGVRPNRIQRLPPTFEEYLAHYSSKKRYNLKRQIKILRERGGGRLELRRIDSPDDVQYLLDAETLMAPDPRRFSGLVGKPADSLWTRRKIVDMAERGFLRSYVLTCGDEPISLIKGIQYGKTYSALQTLYRKDYAHLSPGAAALHLVVEDLLKHRPAQLIDFGIGEPNEKHHTSSVSLEMACVLLLRKTLRNRIRRGLHAAFFSTVRAAKMIRGRIKSRNRPEPCAT